MTDDLSRYTRSVLISGDPPADFQQQLDGLDEELHRFATTLPKELQFNEKTMILYAHSPIRRTIIMLQVWWHQCFCDLYRVVFRNFSESFTIAALRALPTNFIYSCRRRCFNHATLLSQVFKTLVDLSSTNKFVVTDSFLGVCAHQCALILSQIRQMRLQDISIGENDVLGSLESCFHVLTGLRNVYPRLFLIVCNLLTLL